MKKLITIIFIILSLVGYSQQGWNNNKIKSDTGGILTYKFIHGLASTDSISFTTGSTQFQYYKLNPTGADTLKEQDTLGIRFPGDSIKILYPGHYLIQPCINLSTSNPADKVRVKLFKNNAAYPLNSIGRWIINSDGSGVSNETKCFIWYVDLMAGDYLSIRVTNITGSRAVVLRDMKIYIAMSPEP